MGREVLEIVKGMDIKALETQLALHCAPLLTGLKASNLLIMPNDQVERARRLLGHAEIDAAVLYRGGLKTAALLYRFQPLCRYLTGAQVRNTLRQLGYGSLEFTALLVQFADRYAAHMRGRAEFPHEMGLFLGYPIEDVRGFMENGGKNFLYAGYWKVYQNVAEKIRLFHKFDLAKEALLRLVSCGGNVVEVTDRGLC